MTNEIPEKKSCFRCGSPVSGIDAAGLCPRCLLAMNLRTRTLLTGPAPHETPPLTPEEVGRKFPQFEFLECLGRGGMGVVYKARQKALDRLVAVKILAGEWQEEPGFAERFAREARLLARLAHPNIVTVHDFGEAAGLYYLVMEYVDGVNLRDLLRDGRLEPQQALAIVSPVCEALQYAHGHGVVHRDIKPENLLLDREGRVKIADFGVAMLAGDAPDQSGTPAYMAPEQAARSKKADHRVDLYALGVVLYEMLTGERPGREIEGAARRVHIDVRIDEIVLRALAVKPELRFQSAGEMATLVKTAAAAGSATESVVAVERITRLKMSRMALMGLAGSTLGIVSLCSFFYDGAPKKKPEPAAQVAEAESPEAEAPEGASGVTYILAKVRTLRIPEVNFEDATVEEMIDFLRKQARELDVKEPDPARKGINFVLRAATVEHPAKVGELRVKSLSLKNATLAEILRGICDAAKLSYRVDDFAVTLIPQEESLAENLALTARFDFSRKLNTVIPAVDFSNATLKEAIDFLRKRSKELDVSEPDPAKRGLNLVVQVPEGEEEVRLKELRLRNVPLAEVLRYVCEAFRMQYITAKDSVTIVPAAEGAEPPASVRLEESSPEQLTMLTKLRAVVIPTISFENVSLEEAIDYLRLKTKELDVAEPDPEKKGINFVIRMPAGAVVPRLYGLNLKNVPLKEALRYLGDATRTIYTVDDFAVTITLAPRSKAADPFAPAADPDARRAANLEKLRGMVIPEVNFQDVPLSEALRSLVAQTKEKDEAETDPERKGITMVISQQVKDMKPEPRIKELHLRNVRLADVLRYICEATAMRYRLDDSGAVEVMPTTGER